MLASSAHFGELPRASRDTLTALSRPATFKDGELVQSLNPATPRLWLVISGALRLTLPFPDRSMTVGVIGAGSYYHAGALVGVRETLTECHAVGDTQLAYIDGEALVQAAHRDAVMSRHLMTLLVRRLHAILLLMYDAMSAPLDKRLARRLMGHAMALGDARHAELEVRMSQSMLAQMLGASRSQVNAELQVLEQGGILRRGYRRIYITDLEALSELAGPNVQPL